MQNGAQPKKMKRAARPAQEVEASSGNVFADLGVPDADEALAKAELARRICAILAGRKLTQAKAAAVLGIDQPKVSALVRGKLDGFSTDRLFRFLNALGQDVEIVVRPRRRVTSTHRPAWSIIDREPKPEQQLGTFITDDECPLLPVG
jgi:predicted XRE-type DNA-binding protein